MRAEDKPLQAPSLLELSASVVARDDARLLYEKCSQDPSSSWPAANFVVELPMTVADVVVKHVCKKLRKDSASAVSVAENLHPFLAGKRLPLERLDLSGLNIFDRPLALLLAAQHSTLRSLDLSNIRLTSLITYFSDFRSEEVCGILTDLKVQFLKLNTLKVTNCDLLRIPRFRVRRIVPAGQNLSELELTGSLPHFFEFCPNIQHLYLLQGLLNNIKDELKDETADEFLFRIFKTLKRLRTLDLSEWNFPNQLYVLENAPNLTTLILYDVQNLESCIPMISSLKNLKCLDLSQSERTTGHYIKPVTCLHTLVTELSNLECLDISGTNLTSDVSDNDRPYEEMDFVSSYIAGLSFLSRPLKFLGIFNCDIGPHFEHIPAEKICCDHGEDQIILALKAYMSRPRMMKEVLDKSWPLYRNEIGVNRHIEALHLILQALSLHRTNGSLQEAGLNAMFPILTEVEMNRDTKKAVLRELLIAMENHMNEEEMVINCCIFLRLFETTQYFFLNYIRIAKLFVRMFQIHGTYHFTQKIVLHILNSMALHFDQRRKTYLGTIGIIEIILELIRRKLAAGTYDIEMEMCWSVLCNMTDETPSNCERFIKAEGMELFSLCFSRFISSTDQAFEISVFDKALILNMIMLIGNIAEVKCLRNQLMDKDNLTIYLSFLCSDLNSTKGFEISYICAYVLAHLVSEGETAWRIVQYSSVMEKMVEVIAKWDLSNTIGFRYSSLKPIVQLLPMFDSPASVYWAVWTLANLTSTYPERYCRYVDEEGGEKLVRKLVHDSRVSSKINILARVVLANMDNWRNPGAINASSILDDSIMPAKQNSYAYLKKVSRIMIRFLPIWLPVSTLVIASLLKGSNEREIRPAS